MTAEQLRKSILQLAIQGKLVKQNPQDEPASVLLERIRKEKESLIKEGKIKRDKQDSIIFKGDDNCYYEKIGKTIENIDEEIPFDIPEDWLWTRLKNVITIMTGKKDANFGSLNGNYNFFTCALEPIRCDSYSYDFECLLLPGNGANVGKSTYYNGKFEAYQRTYIVQSLNSGLLLRYLHKALEYNWKEYNNNKLFGSAIPYIKLANIEEYLLPIPPTAEQSRIVERLEKLEPLIEKYDALEKQATKLDSEIKDKLRKSILQYAIQGKLVPQDKNDEPASMLLERIRKEKKAELGKKYVESYIYKGDDNCYYEKIGNAIENITDNIPFDIPNSWEWAKVDSILHVNPRSKISDETEASFVAMKSIKEGFCNDFVFESKYWKNIKKGFTHFKDKDVGFAKITPCFQNRKSVIFRNLRNGVGAGTTEIHILRSIGGTVSSEYLLWFVKTPYFINHGISKFAGTAGQQRFATVDLKNMAIPLPPYPEQIRMIKRINSLFGILN